MCGGYEGSPGWSTNSLLSLVLHSAAHCRIPLAAYQVSREAHLSGEGDATAGRTAYSTEIIGPSSRRRPRESHNGRFSRAVEHVGRVLGPAGRQTSGDACRSHRSDPFALPRRPPRQLDRLASLPVLQQKCSGTGRPRDAGNQVPRVEPWRSLPLADHRVRLFRGELTLILADLWLASCSDLLQGIGFAMNYGVRSVSTSLFPATDLPLLPIVNSGSPAALSPRPFTQHRSARRKPSSSKQATSAPPSPPL